MQHEVLIRAHLTSWTGYGQIAEWLGRGLEGLGYRVGFEKIDADERYFDMSDWVAERVVADSPLPWLIQLATPKTPPPDDRECIAFTMWESDRVCAESVIHLNHAKAVIVPCWANRTWLEASGVKSPIHVVPLGVSRDEGYFDDGTPPPRDVFRFGMAARMSHGGIRKGLNEGMAAFVEAFPTGREKVELEVKVWEDCLPQLRVPNDARIRIVTTPMRPREMANWYRRLNCLFVPSKGEGWGLHTHQAMACGRPVAAVPWGGTAHFWDRRFGWELSYQLEQAGEFYSGQGRWAVPHHDSMVSTFRAIVSNRPEAARKGSLAARRAAQFSWDNTAMGLARVLSDLVSISRVASSGLCSEVL